jgi:hypothetical protein
MKTMRTLLHAFLWILFIGLSGPRAPAQEAGGPLPPGLSQSSSLSEILDWLDRNGFARARIGLQGYRINSSLMSDVSRMDSPMPGESVMFGPGFKLVGVDGCRLRLRSEAITILRPGKDALKYDPGRLSLYIKHEPGLTPDPADLYIWLNRLRPNGETPHLHTEDPEKGRRFGWWRTKFRAKRTRSSDIIMLVIPERPWEEMRDYVYADKVSFTFDDVVSSEQFYQAFSRAISLCRGK